jgi:hypothetical protein
MRVTKDPLTLVDDVTNLHKCLSGTEPIDEVDCIAADMIGTQLFVVACKLHTLWMDTPILSVALRRKKQRLELAKTLSLGFGHHRCEPKAIKSLLVLLRQTTAFANTVRYNRVFRRMVKYKDASMSADELVDALRASGTSTHDAENCVGVCSLRRL